VASKVRQTNSLWYHYHQSHAAEATGGVNFYTNFPFLGGPPWYSAAADLAQKLILQATVALEFSFYL
jgi:hypothetical protein